jgi:hypothetical protein
MGATLAMEKEWASKENPLQWDKIRGGFSGYTAHYSK